MLIHDSHDHHLPAGTVRSLEGGLYLAELHRQGGECQRAEVNFHSLHQAKEWLIDKGAGQIQLELSDAYYEMIGLED